MVLTSCLFQAYLDEIIPMLLFGLVSIVGGSLVFLLPETLGNKLPENVEEALTIGINSSKSEANESTEER